MKSPCFFEIDTDDMENYDNVTKNQIVDSINVTIANNRAGYSGKSMVGKLNTVLEMYI